MLRKRKATGVEGGDFNSDSIRFLVDALLLFLELFKACRVQEKFGVVPYIRPAVAKEKRGKFFVVPSQQSVHPFNEAGIMSGKFILDDVYKLSENIIDSFVIFPAVQHKTGIRPYFFF